MGVLILSRNVAIYSTRRLLSAFRARSRAVTVADPASVGLVAGVRPKFALDGDSRPLPPIGTVVPRVGSVATDHALSILAAFEAAGTATTAPAAAIRIARDKGLTLQLLLDTEIPVPTTVFVRQGADVPWAIEAVGGLPAILKPRTGTHGVGVMLAESPDAARAALETMWEAGREYLVQRYVAGGSDLRILVVGGTAVAAIRRVAPAGRFRANLHSGGRAEAAEPDPAATGIALRAAAAVGLPIAGVDILESEDGPLVSEVNASPGFEGVEDATGVDVAGAVADFALSRRERRRA